MGLSRKISTGSEGPLRASAWQAEIINLIYDIAADNTACWTQKMLLTSLPVTPRGDSLNLFIVRACATQFVKNIGVFDSPRVRFRILSSSSSTSPASPASSPSAPAKDADDASDAGDVAHAGEGNEGGKEAKDLNSERGGKISGRKGRRSGEQMP